MSAELGLRGPRDSLSFPLHLAVALFPSVQERDCFFGREPALPWGRPCAILRSFVRGSAVKIFMDFAILFGVFSGLNSLSLMPRSWACRQWNNLPRFA